MSDDVTWTPSLKAAVALVVVAVALGVVGWRLATRRVEDATDRDNGMITLGRAAHLLGCSKTEAIDPMEGPIRGGAADRGVICTTKGSAIHVFQAARIGKWGSLDYRSTLGVGDVVNPQAPECPAQVTVGRGLIVVSASAEVARTVEERLDIHSTTQPMKYPPGSYALPC